MNYTLLSTRLSRGVTGVAVAGAGAGLYYTYMRSVVHADSGAPKRAFGSGPAFLSLELESAEAVNHNTKRLRFKLPEPDSVSGLTLTCKHSHELDNHSRPRFFVIANLLEEAALLTFSWPKGSMLPVLRPYTPINALDEPGTLEFLVKRYPNGKQSTHIHSLQPGDSLRFVTRLPGYNWQPNKHSEIVLIAGGAGITPAYQLIRGILQNPDDQTKITLIFGVNTDADLLLRKEFIDYEAQFPNRFNATYTVSHPEDGSPFRKGYVSKELIKELAPNPDDCKVFVCGPPPMEESLVGNKKKPGILEELGYRKDQIYKF